MKRHEKLIICILLLLVIVSGCSQIHTPENDAPGIQMAVRVDVRCQRDGTSFERSYTQPEKLEAMLLYLRLLKPEGRVEVNPEVFSGPHSEITVHLSGGEKRVYRMRCDSFLSVDAKPWQHVDPEHAADLYPLLLIMESDAERTAGIIHPCG